nr:PAS domain S-box protein [Sphingomicrobium nitratireducens]
MRLPASAVIRRLVPGLPVLVALALALSVFAIAFAGITLTRESGRIAVVWLSNAVTVAVMLRAAPRHHLGLAVAAFVGLLAANLAHHDPLARALALGTANLAEVALVVTMVAPALAPSQSFDQGRAIARLLLASILAPLLSAAIASAWLVGIEGAPFVPSYLSWAVSDALGLMIVAPLLLSLPPRLRSWWRARKTLRPRDAAEGIALFSALLVLCAAAFTQGQPPLLFLLAPLFVLAAFRLNLPAATLAIFCCSAIAIGATALELGPLAEISSDRSIRITALETFVATLVFLVLPVRAVISERDRLGDAFERSERKFLRIAEASPAGILHLDPAGRATWVNNCWLRLTGQTRADLLEGSWLDAIAPEDRGKAQSLWARARATLEPVREEFAALRIERGVSGQPRGARTTDFSQARTWVDLSIHPETDREGDHGGFVARLADITQRRRAEERLVESEGLYRLVTENAGDIVIRLGLDGMQHYVSSASQRVLGLAPEEMVGHRLSDYVHPSDQEMLVHALSDLLVGSGTPQMRYRQRHRDGRYLWVEAGFRLVHDPATGDPRELVATVRDINRRFEAERIATESAAKLRESNRVLSLAEDLAGVGHWRLDLRTRSFDYSHQVNAITQIERDDAISARRALRCLVPADRGTLLSTLARARRAERACECSVDLATAQGEVRHLRVVLQADRDEAGEVQGYVGVVRDVTVQRNAHRELAASRDRARSAAEAKSQFLATMSHEIRTPMTGVLGMIDLLLAKPGQADRERYLGMLKTSADLLMAVLDDILDFSRLESGKVKIERRDFALSPMLADAVALYEPSASEKGIDLVFENRIEGDPFVKGDPVRLRQLLGNLVSNAIKFTPAGSVTVTARSRREADGLHLSLRVADTGIGIDPAAAERLFQPFSQADATTSRRFGGTGLGLAICNRLVGAMGGTIGFDSALGRGSTFRIDLGLEKGDPARAEAQGPDAGAIRSPRVLSILVAEDNPVNQMLIGAMLRAAGHRVTCVENGRLAVEAARAERYDAIIMDMQMPELDGLAATRLIRASDGPCAAIPILALTADASPERRRFYDGAGLSAFLTKPIDQAALLDQLAAIAGLAASGDKGDEQRRSAAPPLPPSPALFDRDQLAQLRTALGEARLDNLLGLLDIEAEARPRDIEAALAEGEGETVLRIAHSLKGAASSIGAEALARCAQAFEAQDADPHRCLAALHGAATRTRKAIAALRQREDDGKGEAGKRGRSARRTA